MSDETTMVVRRMPELYTEGAWGRLDDLIAADYVHHNNELELSRGQFKRGAAWVRQGLPDFTITIEDTVAEADRVAIRFIGRGTHLGSMYGESPTARPVAIHGIAIYQVVGGKVVADSEAMDEHDLMRQIGAIAEGG